MAIKWPEKKEQIDIMEMQAAVKEILRGRIRTPTATRAALSVLPAQADFKDTMQYHQQPVLWPWHGKESNQREGSKGRRALAVVSSQRTQFNKRHIMLSSRVSR